MYETTDYAEACFLQLTEGKRPEIIKETKNKCKFKWDCDLKEKASLYYLNEGKFQEFVDVQKNIKSRVNMVLRDK